MAVTLSEMRSAREITIAGEALTITVQLRPSDSDAEPIELDSLRTKRTTRKLARAGERALHKVGMSDYSLKLSFCTDAVVFRLTGYRKLGRSNLLVGSFPPGSQLEMQVLGVMSRLTPLVEGIGSRTLRGRRLNILTRRTDTRLVATAAWQPGSGLVVSGSEEDPGARIHELQETQQTVRRRMRLIFSFGGLIVLAGIVGGVVGQGLVIMGLIAVYGFIFVLMGFLVRTAISEAEQEIRELRDQQDLRELLSEERERRAQKQFQVHSDQVRRYYEQALGQRGVTFSIGVLCIGAGFCTIIAAGLLIWLGDAKPSEQIIIAALGAIGGILGNFIAVIDLNMFKETIRSIGAFHDRLVFTNHLHFANVLVAKVTDQPTRDVALAAMAKAMAVYDADTVPGPTA